MERVVGVMTVTSDVGGNRVDQRRENAVNGVFRFSVSSRVTHPGLQL